MIAFTVIVGDEFGHRQAEMAFTERDHLAQALLLDRPHDPLRMTPCSLAHTAAFASGASPSRRATPPLPDSTSIAIADQNATISQGTVTRIRQAAYALQHKGLVGKRSGARHVDTPRLQFEDEDCVVRH